MNSVYRCPNCYAVVAASSEACVSCGASFDGPLAWKPELEGAKEPAVALPGFSFVIAEGFFFAVLFALGAYGWSRVSDGGASSRSFEATALWHLFRFGNGEWGVFIAAWAIARCTLLAKVRVPRTSASIGMFRLSAVLLCLQFVTLLLVGPIFSIIVTPLTLGLPFVLTLVANIRVIAGAAKHEG
jgi:hypothetical protein